MNQLIYQSIGVWRGGFTGVVGLRFEPERVISSPQHTFVTLSSNPPKSKPSRSFRVSCRFQILGRALQRFFPSSSPPFLSFRVCWGFLVHPQQKSKLVVFWFSIFENRGLVSEVRVFCCFCCCSVSVLLVLNGASSERTETLACMNPPWHKEREVFAEDLGTPCVKSQN